MCTMSAVTTLHNKVCAFIMPTPRNTESKLMNTDASRLIGSQVIRGKYWEVKESTGGAVPGTIHRTVDREPGKLPSDTFDCEPRHRCQLFRR